MVNDQWTMIHRTPWGPIMDMITKIACKSRPTTLIHHIRYVSLQVNVWTLPKDDGNWIAKILIDIRAAFHKVGTYKVAVLRHQITVVLSHTLQGRYTEVELHWYPKISEHCKIRNHQFKPHHSKLTWPQQNELLRFDHNSQLIRTSKPHCLPIPWKLLA